MDYTAQIELNITADMWHNDRTRVEQAVVRQIGVYVARDYPGRHIAEATLTGIRGRENEANPELVKVEYTYHVVLE